MQETKEKGKRMLLEASVPAVADRDAFPSSEQEWQQWQEKLRMARLEIDLLKAMIDIADEQFGTDIKKKAGTRRS